jgi:NADPH:quinone reductase-like Zn-dependent oxidoreductase
MIMGQKKGFDEFQLVDGPIPKPAQNEVLVKLHAAALNYREVLIASVGLPVLPRTLQCRNRVGQMWLIMHA